MMINPEDLPEELQAMVNADMFQSLKLADIEEQHIRKVLNLTRENKKRPHSSSGSPEILFTKKIRGMRLEPELSDFSLRSASYSFSDKSGF